MSTESYGSTASPTLRTPLSKARGLGSAKDGAHHWWMERVTALILAVLAPFGVIDTLHLTGLTHEQVLAAFTSPWRALGWVAILAVGFYHTAMGVQVILEDYVHSHGPRLAAILACKGVLYGACILSILAVVKMHVGL